MFGNKGGGKQTSTSTTTPTMDPAFRGLQDMILPNIISRLQAKSALPAGLSEMNTQAINKTYENASQGLNNTLSSRGLGTSPIAGAAESRLSASRAGDIVRMKQTLPILEMEQQRSNLMDALQALSLGRGTQTNTTTTGGVGSSKIGGGISGLASMLGFLYGSGQLSPNAGGLGTPTNLMSGSQVYY
jgi:hypothetical protein